MTMTEAPVVNRHGNLENMNKRHKTHSVNIKLNKYKTGMWFALVSCSCLQIPTKLSIFLSRTSYIRGEGNASRDYHLQSEKVYNMFLVCFATLKQRSLFICETDIILYQQIWCWPENLKITPTEERYHGYIHVWAVSLSMIYLCLGPAVTANEPRRWLWESWSHHVCHIVLCKAFHYCNIKKNIKVCGRLGVSLITSLFGRWGADNHRIVNCSVKEHHLYNWS